MLQKLLHGLSIVLIVAACGLAALFAMSRFGWKALAIPTGSMEPAIHKNSLVIVRSVPPTNLKVGDVITYKNPLSLATTISHRIVETKVLQGGVIEFVTKGDANKVPDVPITEGSVVGKVVWHVPHVGFWLLWSKSWFGVAALVYIPAALLLTTEVKRLADYWGGVVYKLYPVKRDPFQRWRRLTMTAGISLAIVLTATIAPIASALLQSNTVALTNNRLTTKVTQPPPTCSTSNNNHVSVNNTSNQTAGSGSANSSGNTNGGSATSGNASNNNTTTTTITINNC